MSAHVHDPGSWPALPLQQWQDTYDTLHLWTQIVGKTRMALAPMMNHWWHVTLYLTARGLSTSPMPAGDRTVEVEFDFLDHVLSVRTSDGATRGMKLAPRTVADFHQEYLGLLHSLDLHPAIWPHPVEMPDPLVPFGEDRVHQAYDADAAQRCFRVLAQVDRVMKEFRARFLGKCSPVHFWWGGFDLSCTRFSGRPAPRHPGGVPHCPDYVQVEAYSHECISAGWWPGAGLSPLGEAAFYAYAYPAPPGLADAAIGPAQASYRSDLGEFILSYEAVRSSPQPEEDLLTFLQSTYQAAANLAHWDRAALERHGSWK
jgi:hypothetical protein